MKHLIRTLGAALVAGALLAGPSFGAQSSDGGAALPSEPAPGQVPAVAAPQAPAPQLPPELAAVVKALAGLNVSFLGYVDYSYGDFSNIASVKPNPSFSALEDGSWAKQNRFELTRGYINITKQILPWLSARVTPDITRVSDSDKEGGDIDVRIKYYYVEIDAPDLGPFTDNAVKIGQQQFPYLDFLENINPYRMQGTMFQERFNEFNSADMGVGLQGLFGGQISEDYQQKVNHYYPGRYGSYALAVVNGGGYHASEENNNKPLEYRLTARPLPDSLPGLQVTYFGIWGKGNTAEGPTWLVNTGLLSYQHELGTLTFEFCRNKGQQDGSDQNWRTGYAVFGVIKPPQLPRWRASAQYGWWDFDTAVKDNQMVMWRAGIDYSLTKPRDIGGTFIYAGYERLSYGQAWDAVASSQLGQAVSSVPDEWRAQAVVQINW